MAWISLTESDVLGGLNAAEVQGYRNQVADGQDDPLAAILLAVTAEARGYVSAFYPITGTTGVPDSLKNAVVDLAIYRLAKRCQFGSEQQRKPAADDARKLLERVAEGKHGLDLPLSVPTDDPAAGSWGSEDKISTR